MGLVLDVQAQRQVRPSRPTSASTPRNQVASESALTATGRSTRQPGAVAPARRAASSCSRRVCRARRSSDLARRRSAGTASTRRTTTWPTADSSARIRWLTADGVTCRCAGRGVERAVVGDRDQGLELGGVEAACAHVKSMLMVSCRNIRWPSPAWRPSVGACSTPPLAGLLTGLSLIVAIGAQNAFVLRQGLAREHVGARGGDLRGLRPAC